MSRAGEVIVGSRSMVVLAVVMMSVAVAHGDDASARRHFEAGSRAYNLQRFDEALAEFQTAYEQRADPAFLFNIAQAQRQLRRYSAAARSYRAYLHEQPDAPNRAEVEQLIGEMDEAGRSQPATETAAPASFAPISAAAGPPAPRERRHDGRALRLSGAITAGVGLASVALGITFAVLSKEAGDAAYRPASGRYDPSADDRQKSYRAADVVCFVIGGAMVVAGTTVWVIGRGHGPRSVVAAVPR